MNSTGSRTEATSQSGLLLGLKTQDFNTFYTDKPSNQAGQSSLFQKKPSNKTLKQNLEIIVKNQGLNSKGATPKAEAKSGISFKIAKPVDKSTNNGTMRTEESQNRSKSRIQSKDVSRLSNCSDSQSRRTTFNVNSQDLLQKKQIKIPGGEMKPENKPPLPKTLKFSRKSSGTSNAALETEMSTKTIKVNVNVHITTKPQDAQLPPKPQNVQASKRTLSKTNNQVLLPPVKRSSSNEVSQLDRKSIEAVAMQIVKQMRQENDNMYQKQLQETQLIKQALRQAFLDQQAYKGQAATSQADNSIHLNTPFDRFQPSSSHPKPRSASLGDISSSNKARINKLLSDEITLTLRNLLV